MKKKIFLTESELISFVKRVIKELYNQEDIDRILDKINEKGIESLTPQERKTLDLSHEPGHSIKENILESLKELFENLPFPFISTEELGQERSVIYHNNETGETHVVEMFTGDGLRIGIYQAPNFDEMIGEGEIPYEKFDENTLEMIYQELVKYVELL